MSRLRSREEREHGERPDHGAPGRWTVPLPRGAAPPLRVWVNGIEQREGEDYLVSGQRLEFEKPLAKEGRLGLFRWALMFFGIAGTYRKNDSIDVQYTAGGNTRLVTGLDIEPPEPA
jgi:hypothetical protein